MKKTYKFKGHEELTKRCAIIPSEMKELSAPCPECGEQAFYDPMYFSYPVTNGQEEIIGYCDECCCDVHIGTATVRVEVDVELGEGAKDNTPEEYWILTIKHTTNALLSVPAHKTTTWAGSLAKWWKESPSDVTLMNAVRITEDVYKEIRGE